MLGTTGSSHLIRFTVAHQVINRLVLYSGYGNVNAASNHYVIRETPWQFQTFDLHHESRPPSERRRPSRDGGGVHAAALQLHAATAHLAQQVRARHAALAISHGGRERPEEKTYAYVGYGFHAMQCKRAPPILLVISALFVLYI